MIGDSIAAGLSHYCNVPETLFNEALNFDIGGVRTQHIFWRVECLPVPSHCKYGAIHCRTNNTSKDSYSEIADSILRIALLFKKKEIPFSK